MTLDQDIEQISLECLEAGATKWQAAGIVKELGMLSGHSLADLRAKAIELLKQVNPLAAEAYSSFGRLKVYERNARIRAFDKNRLAESLAREASLNRAIALRISTEIERDLKDLNLEKVDEATVRDIACHKLLLYAGEEARKKYSRIGLPSSQVKKVIQEQGVEGLSREVSKEYVLAHVIPEGLNEAVYNRFIEIRDPGMFSFRDWTELVRAEDIDPGSGDFFDSMNALRKRIEDALEKNSLVIVDSVNFFVARHSSKKKDLARAVGFLADNIRQKDRVLFCLNLFLPTGLKEYKENKEDALKTANLFLGQEHLNSCISVDSEYQSKLLDAKLLHERGAMFLNSKKSELVFLSKETVSERSKQEKGMKASLVLNAKRIALASRNPKRFNSMLKEALKKTVKLGGLCQAEGKKTEVVLNYLREACVGFGLAEEEILKTLGEEAKQATLACPGREAGVFCLDDKKRYSFSNAGSLKELKEALGKGVSVVNFKPLDKGLH